MVFAIRRDSREIPFFDLIILLLPCTFNEHSLEGTKFPPPVYFLRGGFARRGWNIFAFEMPHTQRTVEYRASIFIGKHG
jgi:hypothetical protein